MNVYERCPTVNGERFTLRLVSEKDCLDLLRVYSDTAAVPLFNGDDCNGEDFYYATIERMMQGIRMWLWSYKHGWFVRWSIIDRLSNHAVGTIEFCPRVSDDYYNGSGILRLDLRSDFENEAIISRLLPLIIPSCFEWFGCEQLITKIPPAASQRAAAMRAIGFEPSDRPMIGQDGSLYEHYWTLQA